MSDDDVKILQRDTLYQGFARVDRYRLIHKLHRGGWSAEIEREIFERGRAVGALLYDPQRDDIVVIEQFRIAPHLAGMSGWQLEVVAGMVDRDGEKEIEVAKRETQEEAGLTIIGEPELIHRFMPSPGACTEIIDLYCARIDASHAGGIHGLAAEHEDIKVVVLSFAAAMEKLNNQQIMNSPLMIALYWLARERDRLRRDWR